MKTYILSHFIDHEPSKHGSQEIPFITKRDQFYYLGFEENTPIPEEIIKKEVEKKFYIPIIGDIQISENESVWMNKEGEVFIADSENPFSGKQTFLRKFTPN